MDLDAMIGRFQIKYSVLNRLNLPDDSKLTIFIDLHMIMRDIIRNLGRPDFINSRDKEEVQRIAHGLLNLVAHYRKFFVSRNQNTRFYFIYNTKVPTVQKEIYPDYGKDYFDLYKVPEYIPIKERIFSEDGYLSKLCDYVPEVYLLNTQGVEDLFTVDYCIEALNSDRTSIIITRNEKFFSLVSKDVSVLRYGKADGSKLVHRKNLYGFKDSTELSWELYKYFSALQGYKKMGVERVNKNCTPSKLIKLFEQLLKDQHITNNVSLNSLCEILRDKMFISEEQEDVFRANCKLLIPRKSIDNKLQKSEKSKLELSATINIENPYKLKQVTKEEVLVETLYRYKTLIKHTDRWR